MAKSGKRKVSAKEKIPAHVDRLYKAVENYVKANGGGILVIGGIQMIQWPTDSEHKFTIGIQCMGTKPTYKACAAAAKGKKK